MITKEKIKQYFQNNPDATYRQSMKDLNLSSLSIIHHHLKKQGRPSYSELNQRLEKSKRIIKKLWAVRYCANKYFKETE